MKILLVAHQFPPHAVGGVEVYTHHLARALGERHRVTVFYRHDTPGVPPPDEQDEPCDGFRTRRVSLAGATAPNARPSHGTRVLRAARPKPITQQFFGTFYNRPVEASFGRLLDELQPDVIHFQHALGLSVGLLPQARKAGVPTLLTLHDYWWICANAQLLWPDARTCRGKAWGANCVRCAVAARSAPDYLQKLRPAVAPLFLFRDRAVRRAALCACRFVAPSRFLTEMYVAAGFPAGRFLYLENGIAPLSVRPDGARGQAPDGAGGFASQDGRLRVTYLGSIAWQKGVHVLVAAFNALPAGAARLRIWGDPGLFPEYSDRLKRQLTHPDARLMGRIDNDRVGEVLADSDVIVVPSVWYENSPVVIQEARAAGVPVVASGHGALAEKVRDGVDGLTFPPGDADALARTLQRLIEDRALLARLRQGIRPAMSIAEHSSRLEEIYAHLVGGGLDMGEHAEGGRAG